MRSETLLQSVFIGIALSLLGCSTPSVEGAAETAVRAPATSPPPDAATADVRVPERTDAAAKAELASRCEARESAACEELLEASALGSAEHRLALSVLYLIQEDLGPVDPIRSAMILDGKWHAISSEGQADLCMSVKTLGAAAVSEEFASLPLRPEALGTSPPSGWSQDPVDPRDVAWYLNDRCG